MHVRDLLRRFEEIQTKKIAEADKELGMGKAGNWEDYRRRCGITEGRRAALSDLSALIDDITQHDNEDDT